MNTKKIELLLLLLIIAILIFAATMFKPYQVVGIKGDESDDFGYRVNVYTGSVRPIWVSREKGYAGVLLPELEAIDSIRKHISSKSPAIPPPAFDEDSSKK